MSRSNRTLLLPVIFVIMFCYHVTSRCSHKVLLYHVSDFNVHILAVVLLMYNAIRTLFLTFMYWFQLNNISPLLWTVVSKMQINISRWGELYYDIAQFSGKYSNPTCAFYSFLNTLLNIVVCLYFCLSCIYVKTSQIKNGPHRWHKILPIRFFWFTLLLYSHVGK